MIYEEGEFCELDVGLNILLATHAGIGCWYFTSGGEISLIPQNRFECLDVPNIIIVVIFHLVKLSL